MDKIMYVRNIGNDFTFVSDSQDTKVIKGITKENEFNSYFVLQEEEGDYKEIYGMYGIVPYLDKRLYKLL